MTDDRTMIPTGRPDAPRDAGAVADDPVVLVEQYKVYAELTMRVTELRYKANQFHAATNFVIVSAIGTILLSVVGERGFDLLTVADAERFPVWALFAIFVLASFGARDQRLWTRRLENAKVLIGFRYEEIDALESRLPAQPYRHEYQRILAAKQAGAYENFTDLERGIPQMFAWVYGLVLVGVVTLVALKFPGVATGLCALIPGCASAI